MVPYVSDGLHDFYYNYAAAKTLNMDVIELIAFIVQASRYIFGNYKINT